jgi:hypothetical protein
MGTLLVGERARSRWHTAALFLIASGIVFAGYRFHGAVGFNVADEGYLWDGVRRTVRGDVPIRDFNAYDPGRYYWCAAGARLFGDGLLGVRLSASLFRALGLFLGLLAARRVVPSLRGLALVALLLWVWNPTFYKTFEPAVAMAAVYAGVLLIEHPAPRRHFLAGLVAGFAAVFGRNLGVYTTLAQACLIGLLTWKGVGVDRLRRRVGAWGAGVAFGFAPVLFMVACVPGFVSSFVESVRFYFAFGRTNIPLPVPWPWAVVSGNKSWLESSIDLSAGLFFILWPAFILVALAPALRTRPEQMRGRALFVASVFVGLFFAHHAFARSDYQHLAHVIPPLLLGLVSVPTALGRRWRSPGVAITAAALAGFSFVAAFPYNFPVQFARRVCPAWPYVRCEVNGEALRVPTWLSGAIPMFREVIGRHLAPGERFLIAPLEAGYYPLLGQTSPVWSTYFVYTLESRQRRMIEELHTNRVGLALVNDSAAVDGNAAYRFRHSHAILWQHLRDHFQMISDSSLPPGWVLFIRPDSADTARAQPRGGT